MEIYINHGILYEENYYYIFFLISHFLEWGLSCFPRQWKYTHLVIVSTENLNYNYLCSFEEKNRKSFLPQTQLNEKHRCKSNLNPENIFMCSTNLKDDFSQILLDTVHNHQPIKRWAVWQGTTTCSSSVINIHTYQWTTLCHHVNVSHNIINNANDVDMFFVINCLRFVKLTTWKIGRKMYTAGGEIFEFHGLQKSRSDYPN